MTEPRLFDDGVKLSGRGGSSHTQDEESSAISHSERVQRSALWAAYGDALGWISELTDKRGLERRTAGQPLCQPIEWKRRIGGRVGVTANLPKGCYSDDSQLRLATGRSIRADGFDVEAFSKVELPVWLSYALGGGKSTSAAASNLARPRVQWFANTYKGWTDSGGNGAAMRIQPHVWAAHALNDPTTFLPDVVRNAICTHSHPDGMMGAVLHALALAHALNAGDYPTSDDLMDALEVAAKIPAMIQGDMEIGQYWRGSFEHKSGAFADAWTRAIDSCRNTIQVTADTEKQTGSERYDALVDRLDLADPARRGSGMLTAVAAVGLTWCEPQPEAALRIAANAIGTDTDTIATMAGAILGVNAETDPPVEVLDSALFRSEAERLSAIANGKTPKDYQYPDLLHWVAPKTRADALVHLDNGDLHVVGLGNAKAVKEPIPSSVDGFEWQWVKLEIGQTLLIKHRKHLASKGGKFGSLPVKQPEKSSQPIAKDLIQITESVQRADDGPSRVAHPSQYPPKDRSQQSERQPDIEAMIDYLEKHKYADEDVGRAIRRVTKKCSTAQIAVFLGVLIDRLRELPAPPPPKQKK
ncbi:MAG: ADP-ribosylglycohydrolase family protein [Chloroflexi bacterium]|nr:ADP-ribosylglycohydrolase family protein [Chloroflexota bacterium]